MKRPETTRRFHRLPTQATLLFAGVREAGYARLCDISHGGMGVRRAIPALSEGTRVPVTVAIGLNRVGPFAARVVWSSPDRAGLELDWADPAVRSQLAQAIRCLIPYAPVVRPPPDDS